MNTKKQILVDNDLFNKTSKKLLSQLKKDSSTKLNLSKTKELLSQSFGFNNYHHLKTFFDTDVVENKNDFYYKDNDSFLNENLTFEMFLLFEEATYENNMWRQRAAKLMSMIITILTYMRDNENLQLNVNIIREYLVLDNIIKLFKTRRDFPKEIKIAIRNYLSFLPGFQESAHKQNDTVYEHHGYLQMQFSSSLFYIDKFIEKDALLFSIDWLSCSGASDRITKQSDLDRAYSYYEASDWYRLYANYSFIKEGVENIPVQLKRKIKFSEHFENSWLSDDIFNQIINQKFRYRKISSIYMSDLLIFAKDTVNREKKSQYITLIKNIIENYSSTLNLSKEICELNN